MQVCDIRLVVLTTKGAGKQGLTISRPEKTTQGNPFKLEPLPLHK